MICVSSWAWVVFCVILKGGRLCSPWSHWVLWSLLFWLCVLRLVSSWSWSHYFRRVLFDVNFFETISAHSKGVRMLHPLLLKHALNLVLLWTWLLLFTFQILHSSSITKTCSSLRFSVRYVVSKLCANWSFIWWKPFCFGKWIHLLGVRQIQWTLRCILHDDTL